MNLELNNVSVTHGGKRIVSGVTFSASAGRVTALLGPNGSGKTTTLRAIAGTVQCGGRVRFDDDDIGSPIVRRKIAYVPQDLPFQSGLSVFEVVLLGRLGTLSLAVHRDDTDAVCRVLEELTLLPLAHRALSTLSGGQRQMALIAQALVRQPEVLLLDEPTSALDIGHQLQVLSLIRGITRERSLATVIVLHDLNAALRFADHVVVLAEGSVCAEGTPESVLTPERIGALFGVDMVRLTAPGGIPVLIAVDAR